MARATRSSSNVARSALEPPPRTSSTTWAGVRAAATSAPVMSQQRAQPHGHVGEQRHADDCPPLLAAFRQREVHVAVADREVLDLPTHPHALAKAAPQRLVDGVGQLAHAERVVALLRAE